MQGAASADVESEHAARGTACHQIAEMCLRSGGNAIDHLGDKISTKSHSIEIDEELITSAQTYLDYVRSKQAAYPVGEEPPKLWIEQRFVLDDLSPPFDAGGTGDAVLYFPAWRLLEVVDLKNGMGVVDVVGNPQLRTYGLGAVLKNTGLDVRTVRVTIVQPRVDHADGRIRSEEFHIADLIEWTADLLGAMRRTKEALSTFPGTGNAEMLELWAGAWLRPGNCKFCRAEGFCPALRQRAQEVANVWFEPDGAPAIRMTPDVLSPAELARVLDMADLVDGWINAVRGYAHQLAESGTDIPNYQLVEKQSRRKWIGDDDDVVAALLAKATERPASDFFEPKLRSPAQVDKLLGAKRKDLAKPLWSNKSSGTNLVRSDKTTRPALLPTAARHFEPLTQEN